MDLMALVRLLLTEASNRKALVVSLFALISLIVLVIGLYWPKTYESQTTIQFDESNIIRPLIQGTAEATGVTDLARNAQEVLFSRAVMDRILEAGGWVDENTSLVQRERLIEQIQDRTFVDKLGPHLIFIQYKDSNAERAFVVTKRYAELFIQYSTEQKLRESQEAYDFINAQVQEYHQKLRNSEERLKEFRTRNADARPGSQARVSERIQGLYTKLRELNQQLDESRIKQNALKGQLSGEEVATANMLRKSEIYDRMRVLQGQLDTLRLSYLDSYPDVVRLKNQIADLQAAANAEPDENGLIAYSVGGDEGGQLRTNTFYEELKRTAASEETNVLALQSRIQAVQEQIDEEEDRASRIDRSETEHAELIRDYDVNRELYRDLLRRREKAQVSLNLEFDQKGLTFKIQEPANLPVLPKGLRFLHFALAGPLLGLALPLGLIFGLLQIDGRIRNESTLAERVGVPVVASFHHLLTTRERSARQASVLLAGVVVVAVLCVYGMVGWMKITDTPLSWLPMVGGVK